MCFFPFRIGTHSQRRSTGRCKVVFVDVGTCPAGKIKKVIGGNHVKPVGTNKSSAYAHAWSDETFGEAAHDEHQENFTGSFGQPAHCVHLRLAAGITREQRRRR
jgi:hypothetical protein